MKRKLLVLVLVIAMCAVLPSCGKTDTSTGEETKENYELELNIQHHIILDTDTAGDDAMAIMMACIADNVQIEGLTVLAGNVNIDQATKNALQVLEEVGCDQIPVYKGASTTYTGRKRSCFSVFGEDGMGDAGLIHPKKEAEKGDAVDFILDTVKKYPDEIEIVMIGPATNIAMAIDRDKETMSHVKRIWSMGTAGFGQGNATPVAEFNVYNDAEAYDVVLSSGIPITVVGLDMCEDDSTVFSKLDMKELAEGSEQGAFLVKSWGKLLDFREKNKNLNTVDVCDAVAMACMVIDNMILETKECHAVCITDDSAAYGQVIFFRKDMAYDSMPKISNYETTVCYKIDNNLFRGMKKILSGKVSVEG